MKNIRKVMFVLLFCPAILTGSAQDEGCTIRKSFRVNEGSWLKVASKFGDISIITAPSDSITVCATVSIQQAKSDLAARSMAFIETGVDKHGDTVDVSTGIDEKFFSSQYREGRSSFSINYVISVPMTTNLVLKNAFGDISIEETSGSVNLWLSHGDLIVVNLTRGNVIPVSQLDLDYVKANLGEVNWMIINASNCQAVVIKKARALVLTTESSKLSIDEAGSMVCKSRSDNYSIGSIKNLILESSYSAYEIGTLHSRMQAATLYGTIGIQELRKGFSLVEIGGSNTRLEISSQKESSFNCNISLLNTALEFDQKANPSVVKTSTGTNTRLTGTSGKSIETVSELKIQLNRGILRLK